MASLSEIECETVAARNLLVLTGSAIDSLFEDLCYNSPKSEDCQVCGAVSHGVLEARIHLDKILALIDAMAGIRIAA